MFSRIYVHIPFCREKCFYCSFTSATPQDSELLDYTTLLLREMVLAAERCSGEVIDSIYCGGGTPSLLPAEHIARIIQAAGEFFTVSCDAEITLEGNPGTLDKTHLGALRTAGVKRLSLGIQSFDNHFLHKLGRIHTAEQAIHTFYTARQLGFANIGIDLIHALPGQTLEQWRADLLQAVCLAPEHISVYGLTIEQGTRFAARYPDHSPELPDEDLSAEMFELADDLLTAAGYEHYEISNYARPGFRSRHNSGYWQRDGYLGLGVAAHSLLKEGYGVRFNNPDNLQEYRSEVLADRLPRREITRLTRDDALAEHLFLGLRLAEGIDITLLEREFNVKFKARYDATVDDLEQCGLVKLNGNQLRLTRRGMLLSNQVFSRFV